MKTFKKPRIPDLYMQGNTLMTNLLQHEHLLTARQVGSWNGYCIVLLYIPIVKLGWEQATPNFQIASIKTVVYHILQNINLDFECN